MTKAHTPEQLANYSNETIIAILQTHEGANVAGDVSVGDNGRGLVLEQSMFSSLSRIDLNEDELKFAIREVTGLNAALREKTGTDQIPEHIAQRVSIWQQHGFGKLPLDAIVSEYRNRNKGDNK